ncbi:MAG: MMPL family transporter, partial [Candidatus Thalassarchaeaceae archaeon]|nr:MMPL family transporter [Candidatus Thalassarchaeaceae archaeon]
IIEINGDLSADERLQKSLFVKSVIDKRGGSSESALNYGIVSDDLVSNEINESTLDNLVWLLLISICVVVVVLALAFRSPLMVAAPLTGLS